MELSIEDKWELTVEDLLNEEDILDIEEFKQQIFDTYQYLESVLPDKDGFPRKLLSLYKYIVQTHMYLSTKYLERVPHAVSSIHLMTAVRGFAMFSKKASTTVTMSIPSRSD